MRSARTVLPALLLGVALAGCSGEPEAAKRPPRPVVANVTLLVPGMT